MQETLVQFLGQKIPWRRVGYPFQYSQASLVAKLGKESTCNVGDLSSVPSDSLRPHGLYSPWNSPGHNTGVGSLSLLQGIFQTQGSNPGLSPCRQTLYCRQILYNSKVYQKVQYSKVPNLKEDGLATPHGLEILSQPLF